MRSSSKPMVLPSSALEALQRHPSMPRTRVQQSFSTAPVRWTPDDLSHAHETSFSTDGTVAMTTTSGLFDESEDHHQIELAATEAQRIAEEHAIEQRVKDAYTTGYEEGRIEGEIAEGLRLRNALGAAEGALDEIRTHEAKWQHAVSENITALAVAVARHIVGRELHSDMPTIADLVRRALAEFPIDQPMRIRVNPIDLSLLAMYTTPAGEPVPIAPNRDVRWLADGRVQPGGCIVEGRERIVDGRVDTALERLYRRLSEQNV